MISSSELTQQTEDKLAELQDLYLETRDSTHLQKMYKILEPYTLSIIKNRHPQVAKGLGFKYHLDSALSLLFEQYLKKLDFKINDSFGGYVKWKILESIGGNLEKTISQHFEKKDLVVLSMDYELDDGNTPDYSDVKPDELKKIEEDADKVILKNYIKNLIFDTENFCEDRLENFLRLKCLLYYFEDSKTGAETAQKIFDIYNRKGKLKYIETINILKNELYKNVLLGSPDMDT